MARSGVAALSLALMLALLELGSCTRCYQCNSQSNPDCADPFHGNKYIVDCSLQESIDYNRNYLSRILPHDLIDGIQGATRYCHKIQIGGNTIRTCLDSNAADPNHTCRIIQDGSRVMSSESKKLIQHCSVCEKDLCNGAGSIAASLPLAGLAILALIYAKQ